MCRKDGHAFAASFAATFMVSIDVFKGGMERGLSGHLTDAPEQSHPASTTCSTAQQTDHHRRNRWPSQAPILPVKAIASPYQLTKNSGESSVQCSA